MFLIITALTQPFMMHRTRVRPQKPVISQAILGALIDFGERFGACDGFGARFFAQSELDRIGASV